MSLAATSNRLSGNAQKKGHAMTVRVVFALASFACLPGTGAAIADETPARILLVCDGWSTRYTDDPAVDFEAGLEEAAVTAMIKDDRVEGGTLPPAPEVFDREAFARTGKPAVRKTSIDDDNLAYRILSEGLADSVTFMGLQTETPTLYWQRLRTHENSLHETFITATCAYQDSE